MKNEFYDPEDVVHTVWHYGIDGEHPDYYREEWRQEVAERNTQLGYWEWVTYRIQEKGWADELEKRIA